MTPAQVQLVQQSFTKVMPIADQAADLFYDRLFTIAPELRTLFPQDLSQQKKKLMQMLATAVTNLHRLETILPAVQALGLRHAGYGVTDKHYDIVGRALLWTLEQGSRLRFHSGREGGVDGNVSYDRGSNEERSCERRHVGSS